LTSNQQTYRGDQNLGKLGSVFGRYTHANYVNSNIYNSGSINYGIEQYFQTENSWAISHTINIGARTSTTSALANCGQCTGGFGCSAGFGGQRAGRDGSFLHLWPAAATWPNIGLRTGGFISGGGPVNSYSASSNPNWEYADSFTSVHGRHTVGFGIDYRRWQLIRNLDDDFYGDWTFSGKTAPATTSRSEAPPTPPTAAPHNIRVAIVRHRQCGRRHAGGLLQRRRRVCSRPVEPDDPGRQSTGSRLQLFGGTLREDDWKVSQKLSINYGLALGLPCCRI
jgi:hypothetical protein